MSLAEFSFDPSQIEDENKRRDAKTIDKLFLSADRGLPVCAQAAPQVAATGPSSIVGTCVVAAAETLMMLVLAQLRNPGTPYMSGTVPFLMDMRNGAVTAGGPDGVRFTMLMNQLCRVWGLPTLGQSFGGDAKTADEQAAMELTFYGLGTVLAGSDMVFDAGRAETGLLFSPEIYANSLLNALFPADSRSASTTVSARIWLA